MSMPGNEPCRRRWIAVAVRLVRNNAPSSAAECSIKVSIPGTEANSVWKRLQDWSSKVGEIRIKGEGVDAVVTLQLSGVDTNTIISGAAHEDNPGNRLRTAKQLLFDEIGVDPEGGVYCEYSFKWKATPLSC